LSATTVTDSVPAYEKAVNATVTLPAIGLRGTTSVIGTLRRLSSYAGPCTLVRKVFTRR
jgi:hypothetical protein